MKDLIGELIDNFGLLGLLLSALDIGEIKDRPLDPPLMHGNKFKLPFNLLAHRQTSQAKQGRLFNVSKDGIGCHFNPGASSRYVVSARNS